MMSNKNRRRMIMGQREWIGHSKWELDTPCLVIDEEVLEGNIRTMEGHVASFGKQLRPHVKTHKCSHIARMQMEAGCAGLCVAKVSEAEALVKNGIRGILITSPVVTGFKMERLMDCLTGEQELMVVIDHPANARELDGVAGKRGLSLNVLVDLDPGNGRTGGPFTEGLLLGQGHMKLTVGFLSSPTSRWALIP